MILSTEQLETLMAERPICERPPWSVGHEETQRFYGAVIEMLKGRLRLRAKVADFAYGSGYASFIDASFCPEKQEGRSLAWTAGGEEYRNGLVILFSTLSDYYAIAEDKRGWSGSGSRHSANWELPSLSKIDQVEDPFLREELVPRIEKILETEFCLKRIGATPLAEPIPSHLRHRELTNLGDPPYHVFDALFYWYD